VKREREYTPRPFREPNIGGGKKPSVKAPDPMHITTEEIRFVESLADSEIRARLLQRNISPVIVEHLIADRETNGGRWRIVQELR
jgi:hypothetical protein